MKQTIVVVDDEKDILELIGKILTFNHYNILLASDGQELFEILTSVKPSLILLDVMMPGRDGYAICRQLKSDRVTRDIPILMLTVLADPAQVEKGKELGVAAYLTKPFDPKELERQIKRILCQS